MSSVSPYWTALASAIAASIMGQALLKGGASGADFVGQLLDWRSFAGLSLYGAAALLYMVAMRRIPMSVALPCTAVSYIAAALIGHFIFEEPLGARHIASIVVISAGVWLLATT